MMDDITRLKRIIDESENIVFFGGAGVSTQSGIPDFRSKNGIYTLNNENSAETILSLNFFSRHTRGFYEYYKRNMLYPDAVPNLVHEILAEMEQTGNLSAIITQNIDGLHQKAGSKNVIELHGNAHENFCVKCGKNYDMDYIINSKDVPICEKCGGIIKPNVVLYGESLSGAALADAEEAIAAADTLIVGGTSLSVYPASSLVLEFEGENFVIINEQETSADGLATILIHDNLVDVFNKLI